MFCGKLYHSSLFPGLFNSAQLIFSNKGPTDLALRICLGFFIAFTLQICRDMVEVPKDESDLFPLYYTFKFLLEFSDMEKMKNKRLYLFEVANNKALYSMADCLRTFRYLEIHGKRTVNILALSDFFSQVQYS